MTPSRARLAADSDGDECRTISWEAWRYVMMATKRSTLYGSGADQRWILYILPESGIRRRLTTGKLDHSCTET